jgi:hypothetical protein
MPAHLTINDYTIAACACLAQAKHHRHEGEYRDALRYSVIGLKLLAHVPEYSEEAGDSFLEFYELIDGCSGKRELIEPGEA